MCWIYKISQFLFCLIFWAELFNKKNLPKSLGSLFIKVLIYFFLILIFWFSKVLSTFNKYQTLYFTRVALIFNFIQFFFFHYSVKTIGKICVLKLKKKEKTIICKWKEPINSEAQKLYLLCKLY